MSFYHLNTRIYQYTANIATNTNQNEYKIEEKSVVEGRRLRGIWTRTGGKGFQNKDLINTNAFNGTFLTLQEDQTNVIEKIPLANILKANENGRPYYVNMGKIEMSETEIYISNMADIVNGEVIELTFDFEKDQNGRQ
ncbi:MAG: hypothetical protein AAFV25_15125 [Bacteroidota bacterium]